MKAVVWQGPKQIGVETVPDPRLLNPRDAIVKVTTCAICGSDLHLYHGRIPSMLRGDILGHEFMGEVVEVGPTVKNLKVGDRVVVPFNIACGGCEYCAKGLWSLCDNSNPNAYLAEKFNGQSGSGLFGYTHMFGGYAGGQAEFVRVPFADVGALKVPDELDDEQVLFLGDIFPTGYMAAEHCDIKPGDTVAVWGCGPVGQFAMRSAFMLGANRVFAIDRVEERLHMAADCGAEPINYSDENVVEFLTAATAGKGPDACIEAVGMDAHGHSIDAAYDDLKTKLRLENDRIHALRQAIYACRKGGTVSVPGVYSGFSDKFNFGQAFGKGLQFRMGQTHTHRYMRPLLERIQAGEINPSFIISHRLTLDEAAEGYKMFNDKEHACTKVVLTPGSSSGRDQRQTYH